MRKSFLVAGVALATAITGCTASHPQAGRPGRNAGSAGRSAEEFASLCTDPAARPGSGEGAAPVVPAAATTGGSPDLAWRPRPVEGDEAPMPALPGPTVVVFCVYVPPPMSPVAVPVLPSCPPWPVSAVKPRPEAGWAIASDGTRSPIPYPRPETLRDADCFPAVDGV